MHILRTSSLLVRLVLAWFVLTLGAASAAPMVQSGSMALVCSEGGVKLVKVDRDGGAVHGKAHTLDCPLCLPAALPSAVAAPREPVPQPAVGAAQVAVAAHLTASPGAPLPPRGPPHTS
ncbi:DUF2946 family protein [Telluria beijingensis]|uniref:DUF2946 family protein n=1 Tax=Telluria beijingensis TaxID=3068633 RepID=UPI002795F56F|nr:DUF2946 family protein [Massilia sp. REN29]